MRFLLLIISMLVISSAQASFTSHAEVSAWLGHYYQKPDPGKLIDAIEFESSSGILDKEQSIHIFIGFLAGIFHDNPGKVPGWVEKLGKLKESQLTVVIFGLWYANLPSSKERVYKILENHPALKKQYRYLYSVKPIFPYQIPLKKNSYVIDLLWGNFLATGKKLPVIHTIKALRWAHEKGNKQQASIGNTAEVFLIVFAKEHPLVMQICQEELHNQPRDIVRKLQVVIDIASSQ